MYQLAIKKILLLSILLLLAACGGSSSSGSNTKKEATVEETTISNEEETVIEEIVELISVEVPPVIIVPTVIEEPVVEEPVVEEPVVEEPVVEEPVVEEPVVEDEPLTAENSTTVQDGTRVLTSTLVSLGQKLYNDTNLSVPAGQSCASCHTPANGFVDPDNNQPTSLGANGSSFGTRNSPTASYAAHIPTGQIIMQVIGGAIRPIRFGGQFLDGRAETLEEQAKGPFLNPAEMANPSRLELIEKVKISSYMNDFEALFGTDILDEVDRSYDYIADAIAAFERTDLFSPFTSKFDQEANNTATFTASEARGQRLFNGRGQCDTCHRSPNGFREVFSDFEYKNIGVPRNLTLLNNIGDPSFIDNGLGEVSNNPLDDGRFRTPNLRNISITAPYMHNGVFNTLTEVVQFYNTRDTTFTQVPEVNRNLNQGGNIGELGLNGRDIQDIVAFLQTLTDQ